MRCSVSELAPGVKGIMMVIGRDDRSSARASSLAVTVTAKTAAKMTAARDMLGLPVLERGGKGSPDALFDLRWGRQHQRIAKLDDLPDVVRIDDFERHQSTRCVLDIDVARFGDQMVQAFERDLDDVIVGIVGNAEQRQPLRFDLIAKAQRGDLDFGLFAFERGRDAIEERAPLLFVELAGRHGDLPFGTRVQEWRMLRLSSWRTSRPRHRARCASIKNLLRLEVVQSSRFSPRRVRSVQLGGSLAGKLSSKLSSILSSAVAAAGGSAWCLRRACADPCRCCRMDRGIMSPAGSWRSHKYGRNTRPTRRACAHDTPPARGGTLLANAIRAASIASTDLAHLPFEVNALSGHLTSPLGTRTSRIVDPRLRRAFHAAVDVEINHRSRGWSAKS